jgi:16S rRNA (cytosine967-C5)-methyltransferase
MKVEHHIRAFEQLLSSYDGMLPLHRHLFTYFKKNKQMGSSDRRWATRYIYSFFRLGKALNHLDNLQRLAIGDFLCHDTLSLITAQYFPDFEASISLSLDEKLTLIKNKYPKFKLEDVFQFDVELSEGILKTEFQASFFIQPDLFIRVKEAEQNLIVNQLKAKDVNFKVVSATTIALPNGTKLEQVITDPSLYQIQDLSSQYTGTFFEPKKYDYWWDSCAASGGKSLLLHSLEPNIELLVSDVRENSLNNLKERFQLAGIKKYHLKTLDLLINNDQILHDYVFDGILLDAPCSGSGTWGRTPEMLYFFKKYKIDNYVKLQKGIAANIIKYLKKDKPLIYMTCSVFKAENEAVVKYLTDKFDLKLERMELIRGYNNKADSMFVARLIKQ